MDQIESLKSLNKILSSSLPYNLIMTLDQIDNLLTNALIATNHVQNCAMVIIKTGKVVGTSKGFKLRLQDIQTLQRAFKNANVIRDDGIYFQNEKYSCVRVDNHSVYARNEGKGMVIVKTAKFLIVGTYIEGMYPSVCVEALEKLAEYFKSKGK
ncbi:profilin-4 isoform X1 [Callorhinchus milii]|uniref:Profilin n=2 Tax=Callorhinchus milii TaxID=7868 RepID=V9LAT1_CALMI|nr:profilin-4 isoform X1 [Callorhinchus milii]|eukprot:gi/632970151/ref/XP_007901487.1/ PREDICTED: profilin-4 isoform X1 [Callorhinchus milii]